MLHTFLAAFGLALCTTLGVHMALPLRAQRRVNAVVQGLLAWARAQLVRLTDWRRHQRQSRVASLEAQRVIRRARESAQHGEARPEGDWDGNVYRPKSFEKPKKPH